MSIQAFQALSSDEAEKLLKAPAVIAILIAGADQRIDKREETWASKLVHYRSFKAEAELQPYYQAVAERFEADLSQLSAEWQPAQQQALASYLADTKSIVAKLDSRYTKLLKQSWRTMARQVAEASGGLIGFGAVDNHERALVDLPMLD